VLFFLKEVLQVNKAMSSIKQTENQTDQSSVRGDEKNGIADNGMIPSSETDQALTVDDPSMVPNEIVEMDESTDDMVNTTTLLLEETQVKHYQARYQALEELLEFAAESGKLEPPNLAMEVKKLKKVLFYSHPNTLTQEILCKTEARLEELYAILTELVSPVTVLTLRTTSEEHAVQRLSRWGRVFFGASSIGRNFFRQLFWIAMLLVGLISLRKLIGEPTDPLAFVDPFLYGALGALIYLYKDLTKLYINRTLHPKKLSTNWLRLFMGALTGALIVNLFGQFFDSASADLGVSKVAIGFLAGYSVEFFYQSLDRIIEIITPKGKTQKDSTVPMTPKQAQIETLTKSLKEMTNEADKATIRLLLEKL
jgi:hypothetical protein